MNYKKNAHGSLKDRRLLQIRKVNAASLGKKNYLLLSKPGSFYWGMKKEKQPA